jgi:predicted nucleic acid-binding protein
MIILLDNNVVLDALLEWNPFYYNASQILTACVSEYKGCLTANSLTDIFYVLTKSLDAATAKQAVRKLIELFEIISIDEVDCINALELPMNDFEDALIAVCAEKAGADYIVSRDGDFAKAASPVQVISPSDFLSKGFDLV